MFFGSLTDRDRLWFAGPDALYATLTLRNTQDSGGWRPSEQRCEPPQVLSDGGQNKLVLSTPWTTQPKPAELQDTLQVREPHLDLLALPPRLLEALGTGERTGNIPGMLMDVARDLARWVFRTAPRFVWAYIAVELAGAIQKRLALMYGAARPKLLSTGAVVDVVARIIFKVAAREGAVFPRGCVARCPSPRPARTWIEYAEHLAANLLSLHARVHS